MNFSTLPEFVTIIFKIIALCLFVAAGIYFSESGFKDLQTMRMLQRMPISPVYSLLDGPVAIRGGVLADVETLNTPHTNKEVVYYRYLKEEEYRDSDGDRQWTTPGK